MDTKTCYKCKTQKALSEFNKNQKKCRVCEALYAKERLAKKHEELKANSNVTKECCNCKEKLALDKFSPGKNTCRTCINKYERERKAAIRESNPKPPVIIPVLPPKPEAKLLDPKQIAQKQRLKMYRQENREHICAQKKEYYQKNKESIREWHEKHKEKRNQRLRERRIEDRSFAALNSMRVRVAKLLQGKKDTTSDKLIGCTKMELQTWMEHQFICDMDWSNYGYTWHIDHVVPIQFFNLDNRQEKFACFHWSNLKPLIKEENMEKSDKIIPNYIIEHSQCVKAYMYNISEYQAIYESMWWPRLELGYGNNLTDDKSFEELLKWAIRSQAPTPVID